MNLRMLTSLAALTCVAPFAHAGGHVAIGVRIGVPAPIIVREAPPPVRVVERAPAAPGPGYLWIPGHYTWVENRWVWIDGAWTYAPQPNAYWVDGRWNPDTQQWIEGHWEVPAPPAPAIATAPTPTAPPPPAPTSTAQVPTPSTPAPVIAQPATEVIVEEPPPAPVREVIVASPGPGYVWISGYWGWSAGRRVWVGGHWERPPRRHAVWIAPRWEHRGHGYVYIRGYWR